MMMLIGLTCAVLLLALGALLNGHARELDASLDQSLVDLCEVREYILLALKLFSPFLDQKRNSTLNLQQEISGMYMIGNEFKHFEGKASAQKFKFDLE